MPVFYLLRSCLARVLARLLVKRVPRVGRYPPTRGEVAEAGGGWKGEEGGGGGNEIGSPAATVQPRRRRLTFDTATATSFLLHFYIIVAHRARPRRTENFNLIALL